MLNNALAGRNRSASDVSRFRLSSVQLRNHKVGYFDPLLWAVRVMICVETFCIGGKCNVVYYSVKNKMYALTSYNRNQYLTQKIPIYGAVPSCENKQVIIIALSKIDRIEEYLL